MPEDDAVDDVKTGLEAFCWDWNCGIVVTWRICGMVNESAGPPQLDVDNSPLLIDFGGVSLRCGSLMLDFLGCTEISTPGDVVCPFLGLGEVEVPEDDRYTSDCLAHGGQMISCPMRCPAGEGLRSGSAIVGCRLRTAFDLFVHVQRTSPELGKASKAGGVLERVRTGERNTGEVCRGGWCVLWSESISESLLRICNTNSSDELMTGEVRLEFSVSDVDLRAKNSD